MFDDQQSSQQNDDQMNGVDQVNATAPAIGLGGPAQDDNATAPTVVEPTEAQAPEAVDTVSPSTSNNSGSSELDRIKQDALSQLSPLVHKLDQNPEDKYKTIMMMIQASDNQNLLSEAYEAAQQISDEKVKAEALLNIVNEINYFTQKG